MGTAALIKTRILMVEDDPSDARLVRELLQEEGRDDMEVFVAGDIKEGLSRLEGASFDALLLDLALPDGKGEDTFRKFRSFTDHLPTVLLTGTVEEEEGPLFLRRGADDFLPKEEVNARSLRRVVYHAIERKRRGGGGGAYLERAVRDREDHARALSHTLYDNINAMLHSSRVHLEALRTGGETLDKKNRENLETARSMLDEAIQRIKVLATDLHPNVLVSFGLREALKELSQKMEKEKGLQIGFSSGIEERLPRFIEDILYRFAVGALTHLSEQEGVRAFELFLEKEKEVVRLSLCYRTTEKDQADISNRPSWFLGLESTVTAAKGSIRVEGDGEEYRIIAEVPAWGPGEEESQE